jgi:hypothetical protein
VAPAGTPTDAPADAPSDAPIDAQAGSPTPPDQASDTPENQRPDAAGTPDDAPTSRTRYSNPYAPPSDDQK